MPSPWKRNVQNSCRSLSEQTVIVKEGRNESAEELVTKHRKKAPWSKVNVNFAGPINGIAYLVLVDSHSRWPEVIQVPSISTKAVIKALVTSSLSRTIESANVTQFTSNQFEEYYKNRAIEHIRSPPYHQR